MVAAKYIVNFITSIEEVEIVQPFSPGSRPSLDSETAAASCLLFI
jgi:hypothetical protein